MALDTQKFAITRYWLSVALESVQTMPDIFSRGKLNVARKLYLAGSNQIIAIKNWLTSAGMISLSRGTASLTELGKLVNAQDRRAESPWTWWLFHLHLCVNDDAFPYSTFFKYYDSDGRNWLISGEVIETISNELERNGINSARSSLETYFEGIDRALCPGSPLYDLGLIERRKIPDKATDRTTLGIRKSITYPSDIVVAYATMLFHAFYFSDKPTVETKAMLEKGLARSIGVTNSSLREALTRIHQNRELGQFLKYSQVANIDSIQFPDANIRRIQRHGYSSGEILWA
jgi:hypothetical protein